MAESCPVHPKAELVTFCPVCRATKGGQAKSEKKRAASKLTLDRARRMRWRTPREPE
jgi:ribosomal protein L44E